VHNTTNSPFLMFMALDWDKVPLHLTMKVEDEEETNLNEASRCLSIWADIWIINGTGDKLEFTTTNVSTKLDKNSGGGFGEDFRVIAGQNYNRSYASVSGRRNRFNNENEAAQGGKRRKFLGLEAILNDSHNDQGGGGTQKGGSARLNLKKDFMVLMSDNESSSMRIRNIDGLWSKPIVLKGGITNQVTVACGKKSELRFFSRGLWGGSSTNSKLNSRINGDSDNTNNPITNNPNTNNPNTNNSHTNNKVSGMEVGKKIKEAGRVRSLNAVVLNAPTSLGGKLGTKLVSIVNRYTLCNFSGRDLEIFAQGSSTVTSLPADGSPVPFHFDDALSVRFRPKEYGWGWSGPLHLNSENSTKAEFVLRLRNDLSGSLMICGVEFSGEKFGVEVAFRTVETPPFRFENFTLYPFEFHQRKPKGEEVSEAKRSERAFWKTSTRDEVREIATDIMATSTAKLTHPIRSARPFRSSAIKNAPRFARRRNPVRVGRTVCCSHITLHRTRGTTSTATRTRCWCSRATGRTAPAAGGWKI